MIARIFFFIILALYLPDTYIYFRYIKRRTDLSRWLKWMWWVPGLVLASYTIGLSLIRDFAPSDITWLNVYLFAFGLVALPKLCFVTFSALGFLLGKITKSKRNYGNHIGMLVAVASIYVVIYGSTVGVRELEVRHVNISFTSLPDSFDGYRIVQMSDLHVGSIDADLLQRAVRECCHLNPDAILLTGDLQNMQPSELNGYGQILSKLKAHDGVFSVLGNHDYSMYINDKASVKAANELDMKKRQHSYGWRLLLNSHAIIRRGSDSIVIAGEENDGKPPFPQKADLRKTLQGITPSAFVILMQHDPSAWQRSILPHSKVQLTLSGHTHGGQISIFGLRPTELTGHEDAGLYSAGARKLFVSTGLGGLVPFRFNMPPQIAVITIRKTEQKYNK